MTFSVDWIKVLKLIYFEKAKTIPVNLTFTEWKTNQMGDFGGFFAAFLEYTNFTVRDVLLSDTISNENILFSKKCVIVSWSLVL